MVYASFLSSYIILWWGQVLWAVMVTLTGDVLFLLKWNHIWLSVQMLPYKMSLIWFWHSGMTPSVCAGREEKRKRCESLRSHSSWGTEAREGTGQSSPSKHQSRSVGMLISVITLYQENQPENGRSQLRNALEKILGRIGRITTFLRKMIYLYIYIHVIYIIYKI